ncbi:AAA family ATPase [Telluribacter sp. SYSU D00476]|uniref:AAA family ATPase n=1 Tax=Telluribacter sp. SYSU D00476 TaxID=2811430 RepID=UPI001FF51E41|nr:AAA family ATPase [Telluribacter sp. SYSU D00476]
MAANQDHPQPEEQGKDNNSSTKAALKPDLSGLQSLQDHMEEIANFKDTQISDTNIAPTLEAFARFRITDTSSIPPPIPVITINGEIISTEGNLTTISGAAKSGKSALTSFIIAGAIVKSSSEITDGLHGLTVEPNTEDKAIIHIDTEQALHKHQHNLRTILRRAAQSTCPDYLLSYNIRELDINQYQSCTEGICQAASEKFEGIHLIIIDGIADFIRDVNDPDASNAIVKFFEGLAVRYACPIIVIVHTNPGSDKERGHLGSQCQRKSESVIQVKSEGDVSYIEPKFLRMAGKGDIPQLQFTYSKEKGYHVDAGVKQTQQTNKDSERVEDILNICKQIFSGQKSYTYGDAIEKIMAATKKKNRTAKDIFKEARAHGFIEEGGDSNWRLSTGAN